MLFNWFNQAPLLEEESTQWLLDTFNWCLNQFDSEFFYQNSLLVIPSNRHFPGRVDSHHGMAELIFERVKHYAGMTHWPCDLVAAGSCALDIPTQIFIPGHLRGTKAVPVAPEWPRLPIQYDPQQVSNPEALIATYAHTLAHYLGTTAQQKPPGDAEHWPYATEVLAIFMGFGLMFANSAFNFQGGCGSCRTVGRTAYLSERESTYTLAIFCVLKNIPPNTVTRHLKKHLRGFFKRAMKEVAADPIVTLAHI